MGLLVCLVCFDLDLLLTLFVVWVIVEIVILLNFLGLDLEF